MDIARKESGTDGEDQSTTRKGKYEEKGERKVNEQKRTPDPGKVFAAIAWIMSQRDGRQVKLTAVRNTNEAQDQKKMAG